MTALQAVRRTAAAALLAATCIPSPAEGLVLGTTRYLRDDLTVGHELTRIEADSMGVVLTQALSIGAPEPHGATVFQRLAGSWEGAGTLLGAPARFTMRWDVANGLAGLRFSNAVVDEAGTATPVLTAVAIYRTEGMQEGVWLDTRGERVELTWTTEDDALVVTWRASSESGRTKYRPVGPETVEVVDEVMGVEGWRVFGRARYTKIDPAP